MVHQAACREHTTFFSDTTLTLHATIPWQNKQWRACNQKSSRMKEEKWKSFWFQEKNGLNTVPVECLSRARTNCNKMGRTLRDVDLLTTVCVPSGRLKKYTKAPSADFWTANKSCHGSATSFRLEQTHWSKRRIMEVQPLGDCWFGTVMRNKYMEIKNESLVLSGRKLDTQNLDEDVQEMFTHKDDGTVEMRRWINDVRWNYYRGLSKMHKDGRRRPRP